MCSSFFKQIQLPEGSLACWVFLSCLEVLQTSEKLNDPNQSNAHSLYTASLWDYARRKVTLLLTFLYHLHF